MQTSSTETFESKSLTAFVLGGTGTVGKSIVQALLDNPHFLKITIIGRHPLESSEISAHPSYSKIQQVTIDFENPSTYQDAFNGYDVGFCALGISFTESASADDDEYYRITHDYCLSTAKLALTGGCQHFHFVSAAGASDSSMFFWSRTKAEVEEEMKALGFNRLSIYRPGGIVERKEDLVKKMGFKFLDPYNLISVDSVTLGIVIVNSTFRKLEKEAKWETLENVEINELGKKFTKTDQPQPNTQPTLPV